MFNFFSNWEQFLKIPGNSKCCDCEHPEPRWASINLGITLCIACSGVHRSLGVHHSKVRSLTLDAWEPEIVKVMMELGNQIVNRVYEAKFDGSVQRATEKCDGSVREAWIKAKYIERKFVLPILESFEQKSPETNVKVRRWNVRRLRRRPKTRQTNSSTLTTTEDDDHSSRSSVSGSSLFMIGKDLIDPLLKDDLALSSDQDSTGGEDNAMPDEDDIENLTADLLLFKSSAVHNLPVMCHALACGANKLWKNDLNLNRTALHQAVLSVKILVFYFLIDYADNIVDSFRVL